MDEPLPDDRAELGERMTVEALTAAAARMRDEALGATVRRLREAADMSTPELADRVGVTGFHLSQCEEGRCGLSLDEIAALSAALGVAVADLYRLDGVKAAASPHHIRLVSSRLL